MVYHTGCEQRVDSGNCGYSYKNYVLRMAPKNKQLLFV
jgi:hypothetical protein